MNDIKQLAATPTPKLTPQEKLNANKLMAGLCGEEFTRLHIQHGGSISKDLSNTNLKYSYYEGTTFEKCNFTNVAATGVIWRESNITSCIFDHADFEYADLSRSTWSSLQTGHGKIKTPRTTVIGAGFNGCNLRNSTIKDVLISGSSFALADFTDSEISNCVLKGTFEGCTFRGSKITNVSFIDSNIDYADFTDVKFTAVEFSISHFQNIFGLSAESFDDKHGVFLSSDTLKNGTRNKITYSELKKIKNDLINFYILRNDYFAAANINIFFQEYDEFLKNFVRGARLALIKEDYRILKFLCKLIGSVEQETKAFGRHRLRQLYDMIITRIGESDNPAKINQYELHDGQIRNYLLTKPDETFTISYISKAVSGMDAIETAHIVAQAIDSVCQEIGIDIDILSSSFEMYSPPTNTIEIKIINVLTENTLQSSNNKSRWDSATKFMAAVSTISMLFSGMSAFSEFIHKKATEYPEPYSRQIIQENHTKIYNLTIQDSYVLKNSFRIIAKSENGGIVILDDALEECRNVKH